MWKKRYGNTEYHKKLIYKKPLPLHSGENSEYGQGLKKNYKC